MILILLGPSGCGKGTQAQLLSQKYGLPHYSTGQIIRDETAAGTPEGLEACDYANRGVWAPDELVFKMLAKRLAGPEAQKGFILDAFPRTVNQAQILEAYLREKGLSVAKVLLLETDEETAITRIQNRLAEDLKAKGEVRPDEGDEIIRKRLQSYRESINPILNFYRQRGLLEIIDNSPPIAEVFQAILSRLP